MRLSALTSLALACLVIATATPAQAGDIRISAGAGGAFSVPVTSFRDMPFRTVIRQQYDYSCGSAAIATLLTFHHDRPTTEVEAFQAMFEVGDRDQIRRRGFSLLDMKSYLESLGYTADGFRVSLDEVAKVGVPVIVLIDIDGYKHFVVVKGLANGKVLVGDPAFGLTTYARPDFEEIWNGVVFAIHSQSDMEVARAYFNQEEEWRAQARAPLGETLSRSSLASFTTSLPYPDQITPVFSLDGFFR